MQHESEIIILLIDDELVCNGLTLLLEDMSFHVISAGTYLELQQLLKVNVTTPCLIISNNEQTTSEIIQGIRKRFNETIPAILFYTDTPSDINLITDSALALLPAQIKPKDLRQKINEMTQPIKINN